MVAWCAAYKCDNRKTKCSTLTFFTLPKDKKLADAWITKIKTTTLPKYVYLCEEHFEEQCFDKSVDLRNKLLTGNISFVIIPNAFMQNYIYIFICVKPYYIVGCKKRPRLLLPGSIPTLFAYLQPVTKKKSVVDKLDKKKVTIIFNFFHD